MKVKKKKEEIEVEDSEDPEKQALNGECEEDQRITGVTTENVTEFDKDKTESVNQDHTEMKIHGDEINELENDDSLLLTDTEDVPLRRSTRDRKQVEKLIPTFKGQSYAQIGKSELPAAAIYSCMAQLSLKSGL